MSGIYIGNQLRKLKTSLMNPLEQITGICFIGDSITWGRKLPDNGVSGPYSGLLSDPRDSAASSSFVNIFKRYISNAFFDGTIPYYRNWQGSPSGESIVDYFREYILFPHGGIFTHEAVGENITYEETGTSSDTLNRRVIVYRSLTEDSGYHAIRFKFTGNRFTLYFQSVNENSMNYEVLIDGISQGIYSTRPGLDGVSEGVNNSRIHDIDYVRDKEIEIRTVRGPGALSQSLRVEGIKILKKVTISNQGIRGKEVNTYIQDCMNDNPHPVRASDNYIFCALGTNDRQNISGDFPNSVDGFRRNLEEIVTQLKSFGEVIMMTANDGNNHVPAQHSFTCAQARDIICQVADKQSCDFIDNVSITAGMSVADYTEDNLHPNETGHNLIAKNIISMLERA